MKQPTAQTSILPQRPTLELSKLTTEELPGLCGLSIKDFLWFIGRDRSWYQRNKRVAIPWAFKGVEDARFFTYSTLPSFEGPELLLRAHWSVRALVARLVRTAEGIDSDREEILRVLREAQVP